MHMADALISPLVGGAMLAAAAGVASVSVRKIQAEKDDRKIPLMGVMGAFIFTAQMINFTIPGTGSSGHLGGGLLLAILLGPSAGFLAMASVLLIQALFFGDGGLLAYGCNLFNLGFYTCFLAYPLIFKTMTRKGLTAKRIFWATLVSAVIGLQLGALSVVLQTLLSGKTELPFAPFLLLMQPIHLAIGIVEGLVTASVVTFIWRNRPDILDNASQSDVLRMDGSLAPLTDLPTRSFKKLIIILLVLAVLMGGILSWFASTKPDGLEWSILRATESSAIDSSNRLNDLFAWIQEHTALLPEYGFEQGSPAVVRDNPSSSNSRAGKSLSGLFGGAITLLLIVAIGVALKWLQRRRRK